MGTRDVDLRDVLELCRSVILDAREVREHLTGPLVIPVLLGEPARLTDLITDTFEAEAGSVVASRDCRGDVETGDEAAPALESITAAVNATIDALVRSDAASYAGIAIDTTMVEHRSLTGPVPYESANSAQKAAREILAAAFHADLRTNDLVVLIWDDSHFDVDSSAIVFSFAQQLPEALQLGAGSVLVLMVGDRELHSGYHCVGERGIRYSVSAAKGFESREPMARARERVLEWPRNDDDAPLGVLFLGAGASVSAGLKTGYEWRDQALGRRLGSVVDGSNYEASARALFEGLRISARLTPKEISDGEGQFVRTLTLERVLREEQHEENTNLSHTLREFARLHQDVMKRIAEDTFYGSESDPLRTVVAFQRRLVLVTVNFDHVVEARCGDLVRPFVTEGDLENFDDALADYKEKGGRVPLLKLHGDIDQPETLVATSDDTAGGLSASRLRALLSVRTGLEPPRQWWYVGYSMKDLDLLPTFSSQLFSEGLAERWVSPMLDGSVKEFVRESRIARWQAQHRTYTAEERAISLSAEEFWAALAIAVR